jgi:hypothetical protein
LVLVVGGVHVSTADCAPPEQLRVYVVVALTVKVCVPLAAFVPVHPPLAVQIGAVGKPAVDHVTVVATESTPVLGIAVTVTVCALAVDATSASNARLNALR